MKNKKLKIRISIFCFNLNKFMATFLYMIAINIKHLMVFLIILNILWIENKAFIMIL